MPAEHIGRRSQTGQNMALFLVGAGIGWLVGNSASPVVGGVVTSILGIVAGGLAAAQGAGKLLPFNDVDTAPTFDARPLAVLVIGLAISATAGLYVKGHMLLEPAELRDAMLRKANRDEVASILGDTTGRARLFGVNMDECDALLSFAHTAPAFRAEFRSSTFPAADALADSPIDTQILIEIVQKSCLAN